LPRAAADRLKAAPEVCPPGFQPHQRQSVTDALVGLLPLDTLHGQTKADILAHTHMWKERVALKHHSEPSAFGLELVDATSTQTDLAARQPQKAGDAIQRRRLAAA